MSAIEWYSEHSLALPFFGIGSISGSNSKASAYNAGDPGVQSLGLENLLEKEMANHSSILAWKNPMYRGAWWATVHGIARVGHDLVTKPPFVKWANRTFFKGLWELECT